MKFSTSLIGSSHTRPFIACILLQFALLLPTVGLQAQDAGRISFNSDWKFSLGENGKPVELDADDQSWRKLNLPHDWSIELPFEENSPTGTGGGALRGGLGWYRKHFSLPTQDKDKRVAIIFDGVYRNSEVWINGNRLGMRPNGYISFEYDLTPFVHFGTTENIIAVKVDNSAQPNSRWYSGSGIYRNVWLTLTNKVFVPYNGAYITTSPISGKSALVKEQLRLKNEESGPAKVSILTSIFDAGGKRCAENKLDRSIAAGQEIDINFEFSLPAPQLWSIDHPYLYRSVSSIQRNGVETGRYTTAFGIRSASFDAARGFFLNGKSVKIRGVCNHHDLGALGTAVDLTATRRQLRILKEMGCNAIRTSHNPPSPELLDLCDQMGFIVMDEAFDMWAREKTKYDYHLDWTTWHKQDLEDQIRRDRNHPSVFIWSLGNEIPEQWSKPGDSSGAVLVRELAQIVQSLDPTRPCVTANNETGTSNGILKANATELIGYNYRHEEWKDVFTRWGTKPFIVTESVSALQTRGHYDMPSDSIRRWPKRWDLPLTEGNADTTCSAYDNCSAPWGSTHEETLRVFEKYPHISGMFVWTGFDYIGEPTPYAWPARSSYFGIIDLAGFPKDVYYLYQSTWTNKPVLHLFPHWNWQPGKEIDVWAYFSKADEVELFLNGKSLGIRRKKGEEMHVSWRMKFSPGTLKAVSSMNGKIVRSTEIKTANAVANISMKPELDGRLAATDLIFVPVSLVDAKGTLVPDANNRLKFSVAGGSIVATDNGSQTSLESFKSPEKKAFNGRCLLIVRPDKNVSVVKIKAKIDGLQERMISIDNKIK